LTDIRIYHLPEILNEPENGEEKEGTRDRAYSLGCGEKSSEFLGHC
jgi:hypothetical protein